MFIRLRTAIIAALVLGVVSSAIAEDEQTKPEKKRAQIDTMAEEAISELFDKKAKAKELYDKAYGYAVFDNWKLSILLASGRGGGVAVEKSTEKRTYMKMGSLGLNVGRGVQKMRVIFLFQDERTFERFVNKGWKADASANAAIAKKGTSVDAEFINGMAVYQFTDKGLMLQADISGTKYYKNKKLNKN